MLFLLFDSFLSAQPIRVVKNTLRRVPRGTTINFLTHPNLNCLRLKYIFFPTSFHGNFHTYSSDVSSSSITRSRYNDSRPLKPYPEDKLDDTPRLLEGWPNLRLSLASNDEFDTSNTHASHFSLSLSCLPVETTHRSLDQTHPAMINSSASPRDPGKPREGNKFDGVDSFRVDSRTQRSLNSRDKSGFDLWGGRRGETRLRSAGRTVP